MLDEIGTSEVLLAIASNFSSRLLINLRFFLELIWLKLQRTRIFDLLEFDWRALAKEEVVDGLETRRHLCVVPNDLGFLISELIGIF